MPEEQPDITERDEIPRAVEKLPTETEDITQDGDQSDNLIFVEIQETGQCMESDCEGSKEQQATDGQGQESHKWEPY